VLRAAARKRLARMPNWRKAAHGDRDCENNRKDGCSKHAKGFG
jgi:hypothetical protein